MPDNTAETDWGGGVNKTSERMIEAAAALRDAVRSMKFSGPVTHVYNPLEYAWDAHALYLTKHAGGKKRVVFWGMNPGPWGMAQTGVPFGEVTMVRDWVGVEAPVERPANEHPKRLVEGFGCRRSEVSGKRLWGLFAARFGTAQAFFKEHFVANYCPLVFMEDSGRNFTPNRLPRNESSGLIDACNGHLEAVVDILSPQWVIGVGAYAEERLKRVLDGRKVKIGSVLHPSPASPAANRGWAPRATESLVKAGVWK